MARRHATRVSESEIPITTLIAITIWALIGFALLGIAFGTGLFIAQGWWS